MSVALTERRANLVTVSTYLGEISYYEPIFKNFKMTSVFLYFYSPLYLLLRSCSQLGNEVMLCPSFAHFLRKCHHHLMTLFTSLTLSRLSVIM